MKNCKECGNPFEPKNKKGIFCSLACRQKDYRKNKNKEFEGYRAAVANMKPKGPDIPEQTQTVVPTLRKSSITRTLSWYIKEIQELQFEEEYRNMAEMILSDDNLSKKEQQDLLLAMKTNKL